MPKRGAQSKQAAAGSPVELDFLPDGIQRKINDIFDMYFGFGYKGTVQQVDESDQPNFPNQLSDMNSAQVGDELAKATAWYAYTLEKLRYISVACTVLEREMQQALDASMMTMTGGNKEVRLAKAKNDSAYVGLVNYHLQLEGVRAMLDSTAKGYDKNITTLSREISRREHQGYGI